MKGLMIHLVGYPQPKASAFISNWNRGEQYPHRGGDDGACHHPVYERCELDGDWGRIVRGLESLPGAGCLPL